MKQLGVLDVGGTHVTAARVDAGSWRLCERPRRVDIDAHAAADELLGGIASAGGGIDERTWAVAMPDPFDYERGIGRFHGVAKFEALDGVDVRAELARRLGSSPADLHFCNDADAFTVGEWLAGAARDRVRVVGLTLGTGVGSGWVAEGRVVVPTTPPGGRAHRLSVRGRPLEESMSRRAIRRAFAEAGGDEGADVREIAALARRGDATACTVLAGALRALGGALAHPIRDFGAEVIVLGGSMSASWDLFERWFLEGADGVDMPPVRIATDAAAAPLLGAAYIAVKAVTTSR